MQTLELTVPNFKIAFLRRDSLISSEMCQLKNKHPHTLLKSHKNTRLIKTELR